MTATETHYQKQVKGFLKRLEALKNDIPRLLYPHPQHTSFVRSHRTVPRKFIETIAANVRHSDELQRLNTLDPDVAFDAVQYVEAFRPLRDAFGEMWHAMTYTIEAVQAEAASAALTTYAVAKGLARQPDSHMGEVVADLRRDLNRAGRRGKKKKKNEPPSDE